ncbi:hypothetical protein B0J12DRAFT_691816 [Macrophomina phaseolina]|uniref:Zn(2)-C6 fungal-type domain-containing protein n=1 Tax=Macrophomina phaseolina TaxID=35725 RepID=A0ABQ8FPS3_9PEZI|nr:hypothetical protein B0J12DRAFT_691816 [Macrophomina phaseolina]
MRAKRRNVCQICRSRKLACDGKQPACSQCILRRIPCSGYRQEFVFVSQASFEVENQAEMKDESKEITGYQKKALVKSNDDHTRPIRSSQLVSPSRMDAQLETRCYELEDDIQIIVQHYAPINSNAPAESNPLHNQICGAWVEVLPLVSVGIRKKQFLLSAIKTLATTLRHHKLGNKLCQPQILNMYCDSLGLMRKALEEARGAFHIEHSAAIMCLAVTDIMIPTFESTLESGWMMHMRGVGDLAERLGPEPFSSGILHTLFMGFRPLLLISSILQRRKTFLAREEWTTTPFSGQPGSIMQLLLNKASELPALLERYYDMVDLKEVSNIVAVERLRKDFRNILKSFREWELMLHSEAPSPVFWSKPNPGNSSSSDVDVLWFPNIMTANSLTHCWAFEIIAKRHLSMLGGAISTAEGEKSVAALAEMICDSMPYLMQPDMKLYGPGSAFFTFPTAIQIFQSEPDHYSFQLSRCQQILDRLASIGFHFPRI